jgi:hypothetical protein
MTSPEKLSGDVEKAQPTPLPEVPAWNVDGMGTQPAGEEVKGVWRRFDNLNRRLEQRMGLETVS